MQAEDQTKNEIIISSDSDDNNETKILDDIYECAEDETTQIDHLDTKINQFKPLVRNDTSMCMIVPPECRLTPRKGRKCPSPFTEESDLDNIDNDDDIEEKTKNEAHNTTKMFHLKFTHDDSTEEKGEDLKPQKATTETMNVNPKKPSVETDIRVRNYIETLIPMKEIRQRFRAKRKEEDEEDFLNYV